MQIQNELRGFFVKLGMQLELPQLLPKFDGRTYFIKLCAYFHYQYSCCCCCCGCCRLGNDGLAAGTASNAAAAGDATLRVAQEAAKLLHKSRHTQRGLFGELPSPIHAETEPEPKLKLKSENENGPAEAGPGPAMINKGKNKL